MESEDYLTPNAVARELGLQSAETIYRRLRSGALRSELVGGRHRIPRSEVERLKRRLRHKRSSPSFRERSSDRNERIRERFAPLPGLPGSGSSS